MCDQLIAHATASLHSPPDRLSMTLPSATAIAPWKGYEHWHEEDQPYLGVNGITAEQRLWHHFHLECAMRQLYQLYRQQHTHALLSEFNRLDELATVDR